jgi:MFS family permease
MPDEPSTEAQSQEAAKVPPLGALAFPQFRLLITSALLGSIGTQMREIINLWVVFELTNSALQMGILGALRIIPLIAFGLFGGVLADMIDRRRLLQFGQMSGLVFTGVLAALAISGTIAWWHIYLITLLATSATTFDQAARTALIAGSVPRTHLLNAVTLSSSVHQASILIGPSIAGGIIALTDPGFAYVVNTVMLVLSVLAVGLVRDTTIESRKRPRLTWHELKEGLRFIVQTPIILAMAVLDFGVILFTSYRMLVPIFAEDILNSGPGGMGLLQTAPAVGFLAASGLLLLLGNVRRIGLAVTVGVVGYAASTFAFAASEVFVLSLALMALMGATDGVGAILRKTTLQLLVPEDIRGRATSVMSVLTRSTTSAGFIATGAIAAAIGAPAALMLGAVLSLVVLGAVLVAFRGFLGARPT